MTVTPEQVLLFVPNLVGYARILFTCISLLLMIAYPQYWLFATCFYVLSFIGDLFGMCQQIMRLRIKFAFEKHVFEYFHLVCTMLHKMVFWLGNFNKHRSLVG